MEQISNENGLTLFSQTKFKKIEKDSGIKFPELFKNKRFDFLIVKGNRALNVEVNYFDWGGSKQEILNSYIDRQTKLKTIGRLCSNNRRASLE